MAYMYEQTSREELYPGVGCPTYMGTSWPARLHIVCLTGHHKKGRDVDKPTLLVHRTNKAS